MGEKILDNGVEREIVKVAHAVVQGNALGYVVKYRDQMQPGEKEYVEGGEPAEAKPASNVNTGLDVDAMTKAQLKEHLEGKGVAFSETLKKDELLALAKQ